MNRWYFFYSSVQLVLGGTPGPTINSFYGFYDPISHNLPENWVRWTDSKQWNQLPSIIFGFDVMLSFGVFDSQYMQSFPCVSFAGGYAIPKYIEDQRAAYQSIGLYQRKNLKLSSANRFASSCILIVRI
mgnify:FL=1